MSETRARRVAEQIKKEVSLIINGEIKDPRVSSLASVTEVQLTRDLQHATIYISVYGSEKDKQETFQTLLRAAGFIRSEIGKRIRLRRIPEINFQQDNSLEYGARIEQVLKTLDQEKDGE